MTDEARISLGTDELEITTFPFKFGRESRLALYNPALSFEDRRNVRSSKSNDCYLIDSGKRMQISRDHLQIEKTDNNTYEVLDRGSACGTIVNSQYLGIKKESQRCEIKDGYLIVIGTYKSRFIFKFRIM